ALTNCIACWQPKHREHLRATATLYCISGSAGGGWLHAQRRQSVQTVYVQLLCICKHRVLLLLCFLGSLLCQFLRQAPQLPHTHCVDEDMAPRENRDSF